MLIAQSAEAAPAENSNTRPSNNLRVIGSSNPADRRSFDAEAGASAQTPILHVQLSCRSSTARVGPAAGIRLPAEIDGILGVSNGMPLTKNEGRASVTSIAAERP
jgi:hypothetical protein